MQGDDWYIQGVMKARLPFPLLASGRITEADEAAATSTAEALANHDQSNLALSHCMRAAAALLRGDFAAVSRFGDQATPAIRRSRYVLADLFLGPTLVLQHLYRGDEPKAVALATEWPNLPSSARTALLNVIAGFSASATGAPPEAARSSRVINQITAGFRAARIEAALLHDDRAALESSIPDLERWSENGLEFPPSYPVCLTRVRGEVLLALEAIEEATQLLTRAERLCRQAGAHTELARALAALARAANWRGDSTGMVDCAARAVRLADELGLSRTVLRLDDILLARVTGELSSSSVDHVIMITDVVGSTAVSRDLGDLAYLDLVLRHHEIVRRVLRRWAGTEFSDSGDGLLSWFGDIGEALLAAVDIQQTIRNATSIHPRLEVKIALAAGHPLFHAGRPYGLVVNRAARVLGCAAAGEIVVDQEVRMVLPPAYRPVSSCEVDLRGIGPHIVTTVTLNAESNSKPRVFAD
jgi:class 3 adenylate cyclase